MAQVLPPILPGRLYRFRSLARQTDGPGDAVEQEIESISEKYLYCSSYTGMNDPMEGYYRPSKALKHGSEYRYVVQDITNSKSNIGIACFTEKLEETLMWAHYAGNYTGICIEYSAQDLVDSLPNHVNLVRVAYVDRPPFLSSHHVGNADNAAVRILSQKQYDWAYEREWRLLGSVGRLDFRRVQPVKAIYLGSRINTEHRSRIVKAIGRSEIPIWEMDIDGYEHHWLPQNKVARDQEPPLARRRRRVGTSDA